jgi:hypothetical protein
LGVSLQLFELKSPADLDAALTAVANGNMDASGRYATVIKPPSSSALRMSLKPIHLQAIDRRRGAACQ